MPGPVHIFWFRRDLRLEDNTGLQQALRDGIPVLPVFLFDKNILDALENRSDPRVGFIHLQVEKLHRQLKSLGSGMVTGIGKPEEFFGQLTRDYEVEKVFTNHDYEPYARLRDREIKQYLEGNGIAFHSFKDQVIFEKSEIVKDNGEPYTIFTPYARKWKEQLRQQGLPAPAKRVGKFLQYPGVMPSLEKIGFQKSGLTPAVDPVVDEELLRHYHNTRDIPALRGTSRLGVHLRFGTLSIRELVRKAAALDEKFLDELIWREFYQMILWHFPEVVHRSFRRDFDRVQWRNNEEEFRRWCEGNTGYPMVDAGMRELAATGFMHNRLRMITASFLVKHLLIDWRWGEAWFAWKLLDYELASNNGGWQWAAGCGCDAAPYFRIFNPELQQKKFDPEGIYIRNWVPEYGTPDYPVPIVEHRFARDRFLKVMERIR